MTNLGPARLRVLCLHGSKQNSTIFDERISKLTKHLDSSKFAFVIPDAPFELPDGTKQYGKTINNDPEKYFTEDVMKQLEEAVKKEFMYGNDS